MGATPVLVSIDYLTLCMLSIFFIIERLFLKVSFLENIIQDYHHRANEIISTVILLPSAESLSVASESMCTKDGLIVCSSLPRKKCG